MTDVHLDVQISEVRHYTALEAQELNLFAILKPSIQMDGDQWCVLYGDNLQDGVAGFGDTPHKAVLDFNKEWYKSIKKQDRPHPDERVSTYDDPYQWGRNSFVAGDNRTDCPIDRRTHANSVCLWLKGWDYENDNIAPEIFPGTTGALNKLSI